MDNALVYKEEIIAYYNTCWLERFRTGHNPRSLAMHLGYFETAEEDNDEAKANMNRFLAGNLNLGENGHHLNVIDAGCGVGSTCLYLAKTYPHLTITGINISGQQIDMAEKFIADSGEIKSVVNFICEDFCNTSLPDAYADAVFAIESVCHAGLKEDFFNEAYRILKPGGLLLIIDYVQSGSATAASFNELVKTFQRGWAVKEYLVEPESGLTDAGFKNISVRSIRPKVMPGIYKSFDGAVKKISALNGSLPEIMRKHLNACIALKKLSENGIIDYCFVKAYKEQ